MVRTGTWMENGCNTMNQSKHFKRQWDSSVPRRQPFATGSVKLYREMKSEGQLSPLWIPGRLSHQP